MKKIIIYLITFVLMISLVSAVTPIWEDPVNTAVTGFDTTFWAATGAGTTDAECIECPLSFKSAENAGLARSRDVEVSGVTDPIFTTAWVYINGGAHQRYGLNLAKTNVTACPDRSQCIFLNFGSDDSGGVNYNCIGDGSFQATGYTQPIGVWTKWQIRSYASNTEIWLNETFYKNCTGAGSIDYDEIIKVLWEKMSAGTDFDIFADNFSVIAQTPVVPSANNTLKLVLLNRNRVPLVSVSETDNFFITANYTNSSGSPITNASCNFTGAQNISAGISVKTVINHSLATSDDFVSLVFTENTFVRDDLIIFRACKETSPTPSLEVFVNGSLHKTLTTELPLCSVGLHQELNFTTQYINNATLNITLKCSSCGTGGREVTILKNPNADISLTYVRTFFNHTEDLVYNATSELYEYNDYLYSFATAAFGNITLNCDADSENFLFNITETNLTVDILSIDDVAYTPGMQIESSTNTTILIEVGGDIVDVIEFNITYFNGTFIKTTAEEFIILNQTNLNINGIYNISIAATDDDGVTIFQNGSFQLNDTVDPQIAWTAPNEDNSSILLLNASNFIQLRFSDINLFAYEVFVTDPNSFIVNNFSVTNITTTSVSLSQQLNLSVVGTYVINASVSDDHTSRVIGVYDYKVEQESIIFEFDDYNVTIEYTGKYGIVDLAVIKELDRYSFDYNFSYGSDINNAEIKQSYEISCPNIIYRQNSLYEAHFVCGGLDGHWIDFETPHQDIEIEVKWISKDTYEIDMNLKPTRNIKFSSIGGLNKVSQLVTFQVVQSLPPTPIALFNMDFTDTTTYLILFFMFAMMFIFFIVAYLIKSAIPALAGGIIGLILGFALLPLHTIFGITVAAFSVLMILPFLDF